MTCCSPKRNRPLNEREPIAPLNFKSTTNNNIIWLTGGRTTVGTNKPFLKADGEGPARRKNLAPYGLAKYAISNKQFAKFVKSTDYQTDAERLGDSFVFRGFLTPADWQNYPAIVETPWWLLVQGANWRHPFGPRSGLKDRGNHPVVHVTLNDARAYAKWSGGRLPTEAEWENAANAGEARTFPWGQDPPTSTNPRCKIWHGSFPDAHVESDGPLGTVTVQSYQPNNYGFHCLVGNVWEWTADRFKVRSSSLNVRRRNLASRNAEEYVIKGGSHLCHESYCFRYRTAARIGHPADTSTTHIGFRLAFDAHKECRFINDPRHFISQKEEKNETHN